MASLLKPSLALMRSCLRLSISSHGRKVTSLRWRCQKSSWRVAWSQPGRRLILLGIDRELGCSDSQQSMMSRGYGKPAQAITGADEELFTVKYIVSWQKGDEPEVALPKEQLEGRVVSTGTASDPAWH